MIDINLIAPDGLIHCLKGKVGKSLMETAVSGGIDGIAADCGGLLTCATCHVFVSEPFASQLPQPNADEKAMLEFTAVPRRATSRLSCQIELTEALDGLTVELPATQY
jgi:ferredoxin, 2Fe-2S